jgi:hypothetical protein
MSMRFDVCNFSCVLLSRKDHVIRELQSQKKWTEQWGYLFDEYQKVKNIFIDLIPSTHVKTHKLLQICSQAVALLVPSC